MTGSTSGYMGGVPLTWDTFLDTPPSRSSFDTARVVVIPVPYDSTTSFKGGARHGPRAIINASKQLEDYDIEQDRDISKLIIHTSPELTPDVSGPKEMIDRVRRAVAHVAGHGKLPVVLGGEHTLTVGAVQAMNQAHNDLSVLYLDAHGDLRDSYMGSKWGHASVARRVHEICPVVHVGVRSMSLEERDYVTRHETPVFFWEPGQTLPEPSVEEIISNLSSHVYVSVDLDVFDPSIMAAVGTPEPGGMNWQDALGLLRAVGMRRRVVGFDLVELSPEEGPESCAYTAAKLAYKMMGYAIAD